MQGWGGGCVPAHSVVAAAEGGRGEQRVGVGVSWFSSMQLPSLPTLVSSVCTHVHTHTHTRYLPTQHPSAGKNEAALGPGSGQTCWGGSGWHQSRACPRGWMHTNRKPLDASPGQRPCTSPWSLLFSPPETADQAVCGRK